MLSIGRTSSYAISALSRLAQLDKPWVLVSDLASATGAPRPYLSKLLHMLANAGLIQTKRGYKGGYSLARPAKDVSVLEIIEAVEGPDPLAECLLGREFCTDKRACPTHQFWKVERGRILALLGGLSLEAVAEFEHNHDGARHARRRRAAESSGTRTRQRAKPRATSHDKRGTMKPRPRVGKEKRTVRRAYRHVTRTG